MRPDRIDPRTLGRTTLERQRLLARSTESVEATVAHLVGLQAQVPGDPYVGLWSRIQELDPTDVSLLIEARSLVRMVAMRGTIHLLTADDAVTLRAHMQPVLDLELRTHMEFKSHLADLDLAPVIAFAEPVLAERPLTPPELRERLGERFPDLHPGALALACRNKIPLVQTPPRGLWQRSGGVRLMALAGWVGRTSDPPTRRAAERIVRRYLAAFGPASVRDVVAWSRVPELGRVMDSLTSGLRPYAVDGSAVVYDLPDTTLVSPEVEAPPRFLPEYDNVLLSHSDRSRFGDEERKRRLGGATTIKGTVLIDGLVSAAWHIVRGAQHRPAVQAPATIVVEHVYRLPASKRRAVEQEALRLVRCLVPEAVAHDARLVLIDA